MAQQRTEYDVLIAFPYRGAWTTPGKPIELLPVEARALLRAKRIRAKQTTQAVAKAAGKKAD